MATATKTRKPLTLAKGVKNTLDGSTIVHAKGGVQKHIQPTGSKTTLCGINVLNWVERIEVEGDKVNCPLCAEALRAEAKKAKDAAKASKQADQAR